MTDHPRRRVLTRLGELTAHPAAFGIVAVYGVLWIAVQPESFDWHGVATLATWMMTLFITRTEHRDTQAIHAKLDELLRSDAGARSQLAALDKHEPEQIVEHREGELRRDGR